MRWPFVGRRERLRREASDWLARLNGAHDPADRAAFEQWYRTDPEHAATYDRLVGLFSVAGGLRPAAGSPPRRSTGGALYGLQPRHAWAALAAAALVVVGYAVTRGHEAAPAAQRSAQVAVFTAPADESRRITLIDGSEALLSPGSELTVDYDGARRRLELRRGEGRFTVAHEARPFLVVARGTEVVARGTQFVVRLSPAATLISLIEGRVEVAYPPHRAGGDRNIASLEPGQQLIVPVAPAPNASPGAANPHPSRTAMIELDDTRLAEAAALVNRQAEQKVRLADPGLGARRVSGAFRAGDAEGFAHAVAAALNLHVERDQDGSFWLTGRDGHTSTARGTR